MSSSSTPFTSASRSRLPLLLLLLLLPRPPRVAGARPAPEDSNQRHQHDQRQHPWRSFERFVDAQRGTNVAGISGLKRYFHRFGYLPAGEADDFTDEVDERFESAVSLYQSKLGLNVTGRLDAATVSQITSPRCGVSDANPAVPVRRATQPAARLHDVRHFAFFPGQPTWSGSRPITLTYAFSPDHSIRYISQEDIRAAFRRSFDRWAAAIPVRFRETTGYHMADIRIGFYSGDHGDGEPFDGMLGILAHAFSPESGRLHLDAAETWAVDFGRQKSSAAIDLESVATHEIGHVLGLGHSSVKDSVMYPSLGPRTRKVDLRVDDVGGVQSLYGTNPNFKYSSLVQAEISRALPSPSARWWKTTVAGAVYILMILSMSTC